MIRNSHLKIQPKINMKTKHKALAESRHEASLMVRMLFALGLLMAHSGLLQADESFGEPVVHPNNTATLVGNVTVNGAVASAGSVVAVYVGDELRAKQTVIINAGTAWVNILVNAAGGDETATFKIYDAATEAVMPSDTTVTISPGLDVGSGSNPQVIAFAAPNTAPSGDAGQAQTVDEGATVTLDGSASSDADSDTLTYAWAAPAGLHCRTPPRPTQRLPRPQSTQRQL